MGRRGSGVGGQGSGVRLSRRRVGTGCPSHISEWCEGREKFLKSGAGHAFLDKQLRAYFAKHLQAFGVFQDILGHEDISTTEIYLHVATGENGLGVVSPLDDEAPFLPNQKSTIGFHQLVNRSPLILKSAVSTADFRLISTGFAVPCRGKVRFRRGTVTEYPGHMLLQVSGDGSAVRARAAHRTLGMDLTGR